MKLRKLGMMSSEEILFFPREKTPLYFSEIPGVHKIPKADIGHYMVRMVILQPCFVNTSLAKHYYKSL